MSKLKADVPRYFYRIYDTHTGTYISQGAVETLRRNYSSNPKKLWSLKNQPLKVISEAKDQTRYEVHRMILLKEGVESVQDWRKRKKERDLKNEKENLVRQKEWLLRRKDENKQELARIEAQLEKLNG